LPRLLSRNDGKPAGSQGRTKDGSQEHGGRIATPASSQGRTKDSSQGHEGRDCFADWLAMTKRLSSLRGARHQPSDEAISPLCHSDPLRHSRENGNLIIVLRYIYASLIICKNSLADSEALPTNAPLICSQIVNSRIFFALTDPP